MEVQSLAGRVAALNKFISKASDKCHIFFKTLKKAFKWTEEYEIAFQQLKQYLGAPPLLNSPKKGEVLHLYLAVSQTLVSSALMRSEGEHNYQSTTPAGPCTMQSSTTPG